MLWRDVVGLIAVKQKQDTYGSMADIDSDPREVLANKKSVRQSEFYQAAAVGIKPEIVFEVQSIEYNDEPKLKHNEIIYYIIRTFSKNDEKIELICSRYPLKG
ncbi:MAG: phage head-tail adapter protein [Candidatus Cohnella colombiensis]|uniref:Phage head-tail adapter protein n=1 Tax=Candidatus Cohnella colombiensis TaxID=3121368 RepID=A0AA95ETT8_9BACL|nr:MAG: phage head-tail adapter protein [Cohnella sp.]